MRSAVGVVGWACRAALPLARSPMRLAGRAQLDGANRAAGGDARAAVGDGLRSDRRGHGCALRCSCPRSQAKDERPRCAETPHRMRRARGCRLRKLRLRWQSRPLEQRVGMRLCTLLPPPSLRTSCTVDLRQPPPNSAARRPLRTRDESIRSQSLRFQSARCALPHCSPIRTSIGPVRRPGIRGRGGRRFASSGYRHGRASATLRAGCHRS